MSRDRRGSADGGGDGGGDESRRGGDGGGGSSGEADGGGHGDDSNSPTTVETVVTAASVAFTVLLFAFLVWQAAQAPASTSPRVEVADVTEGPDGRVEVAVVLTNPASEGLLSATVEVDCGQPPPSFEFTHVPTDGREQAVLVCPSGTAGNATANVTTWQTA